ncbi:hypothetical protein DV737_g586, partial [Chaetothyriales sp. CBS 132003]
MATDQAGLGAGYNPYDNSNNFMEKWYKAATALDPRKSADAERLHQMTGSPMHARVVQTLITPQPGRLHYGNFNGLPSEWFYDFAQKNKDRFEEHVRSIGYEVDLADTPGLGKLSTLPDTPGFLEMIIPPEYNPDINFREAYSKSTSPGAGNQTGQLLTQQANQGSSVEDSSDPEGENGQSSRGPVEAYDSAHDHAHHNSRTPNTAEALRLRDTALAAFHIANEGFNLSTIEILENDAVAQSLALSKEKGENSSIDSSNKTNVSSDISEYPSPYNRSPSIPGSHSTESPPFQAQPSQGSQKSREDDGQPGPSRVGRETSVVSLTSDSDSAPERVILNPVSQKAKIHKLSRTFPELQGELASFIDHRQRKNKAKPPPSIITHNLGTEAKFLKDSNNSKGTKKQRHHGPRNDPAAPLSLDQTPSTAGSLRNTPRKPVEAVFGSPTHANPMIYHPALPVIPASSYRRRSRHEAPSPISRHHSRLFRVARIIDVSTDSLTTLRRAPAQEQLRTEIHRELANASLNGVSIGKYRYYQGHLTVEEYLEKGMCILEILDDDNDDANPNVSAGTGDSNADQGEDALGEEEPDSAPNATANMEEQEQETTDSDSSENEKEPEPKFVDSDASEDGEEPEEKTTDSDVSEGSIKRRDR